MSATVHPSCSLFVQRLGDEVWEGAVRGKCNWRQRHCASESTVRAICCFLLGVIPRNRHLVTSDIVL